MSFVESARELAKRFGIDLVETDSDNRDEAMQLQREKKACSLSMNLLFSFSSLNCTIPKREEVSHFHILKNGAIPLKQ